MMKIQKYKDLQVLIPLAGEGKRFSDLGFKTPKPLISIQGEPMIKICIDSLALGDVFYHFVIRKSSEQDLLTDLLKKICKTVTVSTVHETTAGPAMSCLVPIFDLDLEKPLVIANCDQIMKWDSQRFLDYCYNNGADGTIVTYESNVPHNSYAKLDNRGFVTCVREKEVISNVSLNGIHFWKKASLFLKSACKMISENDRALNGEFYVGPTYNHMIEAGYTVKNYHLGPGQHWPVGIPSDLERYLHEAI